VLDLFKRFVKSISCLLKLKYFDCFELRKFSLNGKVLFSTINKKTPHKSRGVVKWKGQINFG